MNMKHIIGAFVIAMLILACGDDDDQNLVKESEAKELLTFAFLAADNDDLSADIQATIDKNAMTIKAAFPVGTSLTALTPTITLSEKATIKPESKKAIDFSGPVTYTVTAQDGSTAKYEANFTVTKSGEAKELLTFKFLAADNDLSADIQATIDETAMTIKAAFPVGTSLTALTPTITLSEKATIRPESKKTVDFSGPVTYTVTAQDSSTAKYEATFTVIKSDAKEIQKFVFLANDNDDLSTDIEADIDEEAKTITAKLPANASRSSLKPTIVLSEKATVAPGNKEAINFTNPINYTVTAEDGSTVNYNVTMTNEPSVREILLAISDANPENTLGWDPEEPDISKWEGVVMDEDDNTKLVGLFLGFKKITTIPSVIKELKDLQELSLRSNGLTNTPIEIRNLTSLTYLDLSFNELTSIPNEIGELLDLETLNLKRNELINIPKEVIENLTDLTILLLDNNQIASLPPEIKNLVKLQQLYLDNNQLEAIPSEIFELINLEELYISNNNIESLPDGIEKLEELLILNLSRNELKNLPSQIGALQKLMGVSVAYNQLESLPGEIGNLKSLNTLDIRNNPNLTIIPKEICDLSSSPQSLKIIKNNTTTCEE